MLAIKGNKKKNWWALSKADCGWASSNQLKAWIEKKDWRPLSKRDLCQQTVGSPLPWVSSPPACPADFGSASHHNCVSQFLKINLSLSIYIPTPPTPIHIYLHHLHLYIYLHHLHLYIYTYITYYVSSASWRTLTQPMWMTQDNLHPQIQFTSLLTPSAILVILCHKTQDILKFWRLQAWEYGYLWGTIILQTTSFAHFPTGLFGGFHCYILRALYVF